VNQDRASANQQEDRCGSTVGDFPPIYRHYEARESRCHFVNLEAAMSVDAVCGRARHLMALRLPQGGKRYPLYFDSLRERGGVLDLEERRRR
jgi:hypothetical protein